MNNETSELLTTGEVARRLGFSRETILAWIRRGVIRPGEYIRPGGGKIRIRPEAVQRLLLPEEKPEEKGRRRRKVNPSAGVKQRNAYQLSELQKKLKKK